MQAAPGASTVADFQTTVTIPSGTTVIGSGWVNADSLQGVTIAYDFLLDGVSFGNIYTNPRAGYVKIGGNSLVAAGNTHVLTIRITWSSGYQFTVGTGDFDDFSVKALTCTT